MKKVFQTLTYLQIIKCIFCYNIAPEQISGNEFTLKCSGERCSHWKNKIHKRTKFKETTVVDLFDAYEFGKEDPLNKVHIQDLDINHAPQLRINYGLYFSFPVIHNYGCWCYGGSRWPGERELLGSGGYVDEYDMACKAHAKGYECVELEAAYLGIFCHAQKTKYELQVDPLNTGDFLIVCTDPLEEWCKRKVCLVDLKFIARHWKLEDEFVYPDLPAFGHPGAHKGRGNFNTTENCLVPDPKDEIESKIHGSGPRDNVVAKLCCGDYPNRIFYDVRNLYGTVCCEYSTVGIEIEWGYPLLIGQLYNEMNAVCCDDGVVYMSNIC